MIRMECKGTFLVGLSFLECVIPPTWSMLCVVALVTHVCTLVELFFPSRNPPPQRLELSLSRCLCPSYPCTHYPSHLHRPPPHLNLNNINSNILTF
jgi:hypothetical protein